VGYVLPDQRGRFGEYGGRYVPEVLVSVLGELELAYDELSSDPSFRAELAKDLALFSGRPTPLYPAERLSRQLGGARIYLKREDLNHTGSHNLNSALGQVLLARKMGKQRLIAETAAGQHGVAVAAAAARFGMPCKIFMGSRDAKRQHLNVSKMEALGAVLVIVDSGDGGIRGALGEALRCWIGELDDTYFVFGSASGPHPYPRIVRDFQIVIGAETQEQLMKLGIETPDALIACVGGGANALGLFHPFLNSDAALIGVEARGSSRTPESSAPLSNGRPGILHGTRTYVSRAADEENPRQERRPPGLSYPSAGPEHAWLKDTGRVTYVTVDDRAARDACKRLARCEGIVPAFESGFALAHAIELAPALPRDECVVVNLSGSGDKDICLFT